MDLPRRARAASPSQATGEYAPIPPVFGPASPSPARLKSCAAPSAHRAAAVAEREHRRLAPSSSSSITTSAAERRRRAQPLVELLGGAADEHALPGREPVRLDDARRARDRERRRRRRRPRPPSPPSRTTSSPRSAPPPRPARRRRRRRGAARPRRPRRAAPPARSRRGRSRACPRARAAPRRRPARTGWHAPSAAIPGLPGAACSSESDGLREIPQASACSRAPEPTTSTFTGASIIGAIVFSTGTGAYGRHVGRYSAALAAALAQAARVAPATPRSTSAAGPARSSPSSPAPGPAASRGVDPSEPFVELVPRARCRAPTSVGRERRVAPVRGRRLRRGARAARRELPRRPRTPACAEMRARPRPSHASPRACGTTPAG